MNIPLPVYIVWIAALSFAGCRQMGAHETSPATLATDTMHVVQSGTAPNAKSIDEDPLTFPEEGPYMAHILTTGQFHEDEVSSTAKAEKWHGLFKANGVFYVAPTGINTLKVFDPVLDEDSLHDKTGWLVETTSKDSCILLVAGVSLPSSNNIEPVLLKQDKIYPGDTVSFNYLGTAYKLYATGTKKKVQNDPLWYDVKNYRLYLEANKEGKQVQTLLAAQPGFDEQMISIMFAGDIDGDNLLDLIIDTSNDYNSFSPTLYLSGQAPKDQLIKLVGRHISVGC